MAAKKHSPKQAFVIGTISRAGIAQLLNDAIDVAHADDVDRFRKDDPRLTSMVCKEVTKLINDAATRADDGSWQTGADEFIGSLKESMRKRPKPKRRTSRSVARTRKRR